MGMGVSLGMRAGFSGTEITACSVSADPAPPYPLILCCFNLRHRVVGLMPSITDALVLSPSVFSMTYRHSVGCGLVWDLAYSALLR